MKTITISASLFLFLQLCLSSCGEIEVTPADHDNGGCVGCVAPCTACPVYAGYDLPLLTVMWSDVRTSDSSITIPFFIKYDSVMVINQIGAKLYLGENPDFIFDSTQTVVVLQEPDTINFPELLDYGTWGNAERGGPAWYYHYTLVVNGLERNTTYTLGPFVEAAIKGIDKSLPSSHYWDFYEFYSRYFHTFRTK